MKYTRIEDREPEIWKDVKGYKGLYKVSSWGKILSAYKGDYLSLYTNADGYVCINLYNKGQRKNFRVNRLVAIHFIPNPLDLPEVNHCSGNKLNNYFADLEWSTRQDNIEHAFENGLHNKPRKPVYCPQLHKTFISIMDVQRKLNIDNSHISKCCRGMRKSAGKHPENREIKLTWQYVN